MAELQSEASATLVGGHPGDHHLPRGKTSCNDAFDNRKWLKALHFEVVNFDALHPFPLLANVVVQVPVLQLLLLATA
jgi:hypothetical protein